MSILIDKSTRVVVQGITGRDGAFHTDLMLKYGTNIVAGVTPGKGGTTIGEVNVYNSVCEAVTLHKANSSIIFVPAKFATDAVFEAIDSGISLIVCISEGIPVFESLKIYNYIKGKNITYIGGNCPGIISPELCKLGIMPNSIHKKGKIGIVSRSGTLTYEVVNSISSVGLGQSTVVGIGGDAIPGTEFVEIIDKFNKDPETEVICIIGEIGGNAEEDAADFIRRHVNKPVFGYIAGRFVPKEKRMGHAGAIVSGGKGSAENKINAFKDAGIEVLDIPYLFGERIKITLC